MKLVLHLDNKLDRIAKIIPYDSIESLTVEHIGKSSLHVYVHLLSNKNVISGHLSHEALNRYIDYDDNCQKETQCL